MSPPVAQQIHTSMSIIMGKDGTNDGNFYNVGIVLGIVMEIVMGTTEETRKLHEFRAQTKQKICRP